MPTTKMQWTVKVQPPAANPAGLADTEDRPVSMDFTHVDSLTHVVIIYKSGNHYEAWQMGNYSLALSPSTKKVMISKDGPTAQPYPYALGRTFYGLEKLKSTDDQGEVEFEQAKCRYFSGASGYEAWFDLGTGLPRGFRKDGSTLLYEFSPTPQSDLKMPEDYQAAWDKYALGLRAAGLAPKK